MMMKTKRLLLMIFVLAFSAACPAQGQLPDKFQRLIRCGEFTTAQNELRLELATNPALTPELRLVLAFEIERLDRIRADFDRTREQVVEYIRGYYPQVTDADIQRWEEERALEYKMIDGVKMYFRNAASNLFRIKKDLKAIKKKKDAPELPDRYDRLSDVKAIIDESQTTGQKYVRPLRARITYTVTVAENAVPDGEVLRCWLPFPREIRNRQTDIRLISTAPESYLIADNDACLQRTIYFEKAAMAGKTTEFQVVFEYTSYAVRQKVDASRVKPALVTDELKPYLAERPPHVVFSDDLKRLSEQIVGEETNPYFIARKIFLWINDNIPWTSAREYSTMSNISDYVYQNRHCDCGMHEIFFMTLCRMNGIPTRWQSGWTTTPGRGGMHDWGEIYFEPYGWLPVDADIGVIESKNEDEKWFFLGSMDAYRLIVNDDFSQPLFPAKIHFRSETVDFQRGELEWRGGNLYFDQWDWNYDVQFLN
ncbi:MAG: transglutaminase-like domain-containing protein [Candidatus Zhuqueibacterota bacterium]